VRPGGQLRLAGLAADLLKRPGDQPLEPQPELEHAGTIAEDHLGESVDPPVNQRARIDLNAHPGHLCQADLVGLKKLV